MIHSRGLSLEEHAIQTGLYYCFRLSELFIVTSEGEIKNTHKILLAKPIYNSPLESFRDKRVMGCEHEKLIVLGRDLEQFWTQVLNHKAFYLREWLVPHFKAILHKLLNADACLYVNVSGRDRCAAEIIKQTLVACDRVFDLRQATTW
jgi:hypothetical protein